MNNIMIDLETLDVSPHAAVLSVGAVAFDPLPGDEPGIGEQFHVVFNDVISQQRMGRTIGYDTMLWWMGQSTEAKKIFEPEGHLPHATTDQGILDLIQFIKRNGGQKAYLWCKGASFDHVILKDLIESSGFDVPWSFRNERCFRTVEKLFGVQEEIEFTGVRHNALHDAIHQARKLQELMKCLRSE